MYVKIEDIELFIKTISKVKYASRQYILKAIRENDIDITYEMLEVMMFLWQNDRINQQEIANATLKDKASLTYLVDHLSKRGLVKRMSDESDRRNKLIVLTEKGVEIKKVFKPIFNGMFTLAHRDIPPDKLEEVRQVLESMYKNLTLPSYW